MAIGDGAPIFLISDEAGAKKKGGQYISIFLKKGIELVGKDNVIQVIMDNAAANKKAAELLQGEFPHIFFTNCSAHCIDLMMEAIGQEKWMKSLIEKAVEVVKFIKNHQFTQAVFRGESSLDLLKPGATRFGTNFIMVERLLHVKGHVRRMLVSEAWESWKGSQSVKAMEVKEYVLSDDFWAECEKVLAAFRPLQKVLKQVDSDGPILGEVYDLMLMCMEELGAALDAKVGKTKAKRIRDMVQHKWDKQLHSPIHAVGRLLNPKWQDDDMMGEEDCTNGFAEVLERMIGTQKERI